MHTIHNLNDNDWKGASTLYQQLELTVAQNLPPLPEQLPLQASITKIFKGGEQDADQGQLFYLKALWWVL
jgi:hypothetical protein